MEERRCPLPLLARCPDQASSRSSTKPVSSTLNPLTCHDTWTLNLDQLLVSFVGLLRVLSHLLQLLAELKEKA